MTSDLCVSVIRWKDLRDVVTSRRTGNPCQMSVWIPAAELRCQQSWILCWKLGTHQLKIESLKGLSPFIQVFMLFLYQPRKACENAQHLGQKALRRAEELDSKACRWHPTQACCWQRWRKSEHKPPQSPGKMQVAQRVFPLASHVPHHCGSGRWFWKPKPTFQQLRSFYALARAPFTPALCFRHHTWKSNIGVSENSVPLNPMVMLIIIPFLNGYFIGNINPPFSDKLRTTPGPGHENLRKVLKHVAQLLPREFHRPALHGHLEQAPMFPAADPQGLLTETLFGMDVDQRDSFGLGKGWEIRNWPNSDQMR